MNPILRNILAVIAGIVVGSMVNMGILQLMEMIIAPPEGMIPGDIESVKEHMHEFGPQHFLAPFLAHAGGTLVGAAVAALVAVTHQMKFALGIGIWFLIGGIAVSFMLPSPMWYTAIDLIFCYIPMGYLGWKLTGSR